jgi:hypothetical protein
VSSRQRVANRYLSASRMKDRLMMIEDDEVSEYLSDSAEDRRQKILHLLRVTYKHGAVRASDRQYLVAFGKAIANNPGKDPKQILSDRDQRKDLRRILHRASKSVASHLPPLPPTLTVQSEIRRILGD